MGGSSFIASNGNALTGAPAAFAHFAWVFLRLPSDITRSSCRQSEPKTILKNSASRVCKTAWSVDLPSVLFVSWLRSHLYFKHVTFQHPRRRYANAAIFVARRLLRVEPDYVGFPAFSVTILIPCRCDRIL